MRRALCSHCGLQSGVVAHLAARLTRLPLFVQTVGLVVEGCIVGAVVPGGPCDKDFSSGKIQEHDEIVEVDGKAFNSEGLPNVSLLVANLLTQARKVQR